MILLLQRPIPNLYGLSPALFPMAYTKSIPFSQQARALQQRTQVYTSDVMVAESFQVDSRGQILLSTGGDNHFYQLVFFFENWKVVSYSWSTSPQARCLCERGCAHVVEVLKDLLHKRNSHLILLEQVSCASGNEKNIEKMKTRRVLTQKTETLLENSWVSHCRIRQEVIVL